jgi:hypothetical protein
MMRKLKPMKKFIYKLIFPNTNKVYIGQSLNPELRFRRHLQKLRDNIHHSKKLQADYPICGIPELVIIDEADTREEADKKEIYWINYYNSYLEGYNGTPGGGVSGIEINNNNAKHTPEDYQTILTFLAYTDMTTKEIAKECNVEVGVVLRISSQINHLWLKEAMPVEWNLMLKKKRHHPNWKQYNSLVQSPCGQVYKIENARQFAREHNLEQASLQRLLAGKQHTTKGWKLFNESIV